MTNDQQMRDDLIKAAFERRFKHLDLSSYSGRGYTSKITNRHWKGFQSGYMQATRDAVKAVRTMAVNIGGDEA